jgi:menaquinone-dependent protoporphyrinogen oxidase
MRVLVAYASRYGATQGIAERIAAQLNVEGLAAVAASVTTDPDVIAYDAFVIGGAAFYGKWQKEVHEFVARHESVIANHPTWFFSSGPVGPNALDDKGRDQKTMAIPTDFADFRDTIHPRGERVFFGAFDAAKVPILTRAIRLMPAARKVLPEGDFRDWADIDGWAKEIAASLVPVPA